MDEIGVRGIRARIPQVLPFRVEPAIVPVFKGRHSAPSTLPRRRRSRKSRASEHRAGFSRLHDRDVVVFDESLLGGDPDGRGEQGRVIHVRAVGVRRMDRRGRDRTLPFHREAGAEKSDAEASKSFS